jgi:hypothetical protein
MRNRKKLNSICFQHSQDADFLTAVPLPASANSSAPPPYITSLPLFEAVHMAGVQRCTWSCTTLRARTTPGQWEEARQGQEVEQGLSRGGGTALSLVRPSAEEGAAVITSRASSDDAVALPSWLIRPLLVRSAPKRWKCSPCQSNRLAIAAKREGRSPMDSHVAFYLQSLRPEQ